MDVRRIQQADIQSFELIGVEKGMPKMNLHKWIEIGRTKLEWCFVVEENDIFLGRIIFGVFEEQPLDLKIWQFLIDVETENLESTANKLLRESLMILNENDYKTVEYHMFSSQDNTSELTRNVFESQGFRVLQEKRSFEIELKDYFAAVERLNFKELAELDDEQFMLAIENVTQKTLDQDDLENNEIHGTKKAAEMYFELLKEIDFNRNWWKLAYDSNGEFVGLIVPQKFDDERGAINYIGVTPDKRGNAFIDDLLEEASNIMINDGIKTCIAEIDVLNKPLEAALIRKGYSYKRALTVLKLEIA